MGDGDLKIARRLGKSPADRGSLNNGTCPDVFRLDDGSIAIIGADRTTQLKGRLPDDAGCADHESIVVIPWDVFIAAAGDVRGT